MISKRHLLTPLALFALAVSVWPASAQTSELEWRPGWQEGSYWVLRSPRMVDSSDWTGEARPAVQDGYYLTRFQVTALKRSPGGGGLLALEVRFKVDGASEYEDTRDWFELELSLADLQPTRLAWHGTHADGDPIEEVLRFGGVATDREPFIWPASVPLPAGLRVGLPVAARGLSHDGYRLASRSHSDEPNHATQVEYQQVVSIDPSGGHTVLLGFGAQPAKPLVLRYATDTVVWPDVIDPAGGSQVVATGTLP